MRDYDDLVKRLREDAREADTFKLMEDFFEAADAIEELQKRVDVEKAFSGVWEENASECHVRFQKLLDAFPKWISVKELPAKNVCDDGYTGYLVFSDGYIKVADYTCGFYVEGEYDPNVTHYMPLPKPPKESTNDSR